MPSLLLHQKQKFPNRIVAIPDPLICPSHFGHHIFFVINTDHLENFSVLGKMRVNSSMSARPCELYDKIIHRARTARINSFSASVTTNSPSPFFGNPRTPKALANRHCLSAAALFQTMLAYRSSTQLSTNDNKRNIARGKQAFSIVGPVRGIKIRNIRAFFLHHIKNIAPKNTMIFAWAANVRDIKR